MLLVCAGRWLPGCRREVAAALSLLPVQLGLGRAVGMPKEPGRDAGEGAGTSICLTYPGECWKVN